VITKPQNVLVLRDIACARYVAGGNIKFFGEEEANGGTASEQQIADALQKRLNFENEADGYYESMLVFNLGADELKILKSSTALSLAGDRVLPWETGGNPNNAMPALADGKVKEALKTIHYGGVAAI
jgi:hypothetical protein